MFPTKQTSTSPLPSNDAENKAAYAHVVRNAIPYVLRTPSPPGSSESNPICLQSPSPPATEMGQSRSVEREDGSGPTEMKESGIDASGTAAVSAPSRDTSPASTESSTGESLMDDLPDLPVNGIGDISAVEIRRRKKAWEDSWKKRCACSRAVVVAKARAKAVKAKAKAKVKAARARRESARVRNRKALDSCLQILAEVGEVDIGAGSESSGSTASRGGGESPGQFEDHGPPDSPNPSNTCSRSESPCVSETQGPSDDPGPSHSSGPSGYHGSSDHADPSDSRERSDSPYPSGSNARKRAAADDLSRSKRVKRSASPDPNDKGKGRAIEGTPSAEDDIMEGGRTLREMLADWNPALSARDTEYLLHIFMQSREHD